MKVAYVIGLRNPNWSVRTSSFTLLYGPNRSRRCQWSSSGGFTGDNPFTVVSTTPMRNDIESLGTHTLTIIGEHDVFMGAQMSSTEVVFARFDLLTAFETAEGRFASCPQEVVHLNNWMNSIGLQVRPSPFLRDATETVASHTEKWNNDGVWQSLDSWFRKPTSFGGTNFDEQMIRATGFGDVRPIKAPWGPLRQIGSDFGSGVISRQWRHESTQTIGQTWEWPMHGEWTLPPCFIDIRATDPIWRSTASISAAISTAAEVPIPPPPPPPPNVSPGIPVVGDAALKALETRLMSVEVKADSQAKSMVALNTLTAEMADRVRVLPTLADIGLILPPASGNGGGSSGSGGGTQTVVEPPPLAASIATSFLASVMAGALLRTKREDD